MGIVAPARGKLIEKQILLRLVTDAGGTHSIYVPRDRFAIGNIAERRGPGCGTLYYGLGFHKARSVWRRAWLGENSTIQDID